MYPSSSSPLNPPCLFDSTTFDMSAAPQSDINMSARTLSEVSEVETVRLSLDLLSAARRNIGFLRAVSESQWLHEKACVVEAIRRYDELWMPLISDLMEGSSRPMVLPPFDIEWVWFCHTLNPVSYRQYCEKRFSKLIGKPAIFDEENEEYALMRCQEHWIRRYPSESFENEIDSSLQQDPIVENEDLFNEVEKQRHLYNKFSWPYMSELVYLIAARQRYKGFLYLLQRFTDGLNSSRLVPCSDISLMRITHQSYPTIYAEDMGNMEGETLGKVVEIRETLDIKEVKETKKLWERVFDQPYEKAGGGIQFHGVAPVKAPIFWPVSDTDVNTKYKSLLPRFLLEVCVSVRLSSRAKELEDDDIKNKFLRLRMVRCHRELKIDKPISNFSVDSWKKHSQLYCEFGTKGLMLEVRKHGGGCFRTSKLATTAPFLWNELLRARSLTMEREMDKKLRIVVSITPPVQAPYLLKCVPDRVTDDSGAMISDVILRMNNYKPQEGRWLSRTVLDHAGRECFVVRIRVGGGIWRRGGETPRAVKWEDRIIEIRQGSWSYVAGSIGRAPEKVVGTATPKDPPGNWQASWCFSTGEELLIAWQSSSSSLSSNLRFCLTNQTSPNSKAEECNIKLRKKSEESEEEEIEEEEEEEEAGFVTLVRATEDNPTGKATALLNWELLIVEVLPEEDAVLAILICISILRSVSELRKEDVGNLVIRRRLRESKVGARDWGSVILESSSISSPHVKPWYWNARAVIACDGGHNPARQPVATRYSPVEGSDKLYRRGIIP